MNAPQHGHDFCPSCGFDFVRDKPIVINDWSMAGDGYPLLYKGRMVKLTASQNCVCWTLMKAKGRPVTKATLVDRSESEAIPKIIDVWVCRIRQACRALEIPCPIVTVWGLGYKWDLTA